jgi:hypothetical protein
MYILCLYLVPNLDTPHPLHGMLYDQPTVLLSLPHKVQRVRVMKLMLGLAVFQTQIGLIPSEGPKRRVEKKARCMYIIVCI